MYTKRRGLDRAFHAVESLAISDRLVLKVLLLLFGVSLAWFLYSVNSEYLVSIPESGGMLTEGIVGTPRFINPLLAVTSADKDMSILIYAGLMKLGPDGELVPDMADTVTVSDDGLTYNVILKDGLTFSDGTPVTTDDVIFTISHIQDPALKSPLRGAWDGVTIERISEREMNFVLKSPYSPFMENLTLGILPKHIWESATADELPFSKYNSEPVGSGPYKIEKINRNRSGIPDSYALVPFKGYRGAEPKIEHFSLYFYPNEGALVDAIKAGEVESAASLSGDAINDVMSTPVVSDKLMTYQAPLPRTFAVFFNQNEKSIFRDVAVRKALDMAVDRDEIVDKVLKGYGTSIDDPIPPGFGVEATSSTATGSPLERLDQAREILRDGGWKYNDDTKLWEKKDGSDTLQLTFSISTVNTPIFEETTQILVDSWSQLGVPVDVKNFEQSDLTQTVIRPRKYEALLFGTVVGRELDFYSFWHSSQRNDPGLNIALYANITTDSILANARTLTNKNDQRAAYRRFADELKFEAPAIFLFVPEFTYIAPKRLHNIDLEGLETPSERFSRIEDWYTESESVWSFFTNMQNALKKVTQR